MRFTQGLKMALNAIISNKMRSFLTMLGVIIGVLAVIILTGVGQGAKEQVTSQIQGLGTNLITISITGNRNARITEADMEELRQKPEINHIAPFLNGSVTLKAGNKNMDTSLEATTPEYMDIRNIQVQTGRFLVQNDLDMRLRVAVVGVEVADELFGNRNVVGNEISVNGTRFKIVGVLQEKGSSMSGSNDDKIMIPLTVAQRLLKNTSIRSFYASAASAEMVDQAVGVLEMFLSRKLDDPEGFRVFNQSDLLSTVSEATGTLTLMLGGIAGISLLVGGIGIMNIMLVSVTERTREIGIRKAIGARRRDILVQFLIESIVISGLGGLMGIGLGLLGSKVLGRLISMQLSISLDMILLATGFSVMVGILFGLYPANKASKLRPIQALRHE